MSRPVVSIVAAMSKNMVIGKGPDIPWKVKGEQKRFKELTTGHSIIMGRKTWDTFNKPLPNRRSIVLTDNPDFIAEGADVCTSLSDAIDLCAGEDEVFIIGGGQIYKLALDIVDKIYLTTIDLEIEDRDGQLVLFPQMSRDDFKLIAETTFLGEIDCVTKIYQRRP